MKYASWGNYPPLIQTTYAPYWANDAFQPNTNVLPYGIGRSYGDSCLSASGKLLSTKNLTRFLSFDKQAGSLICEAGTTLDHILHIIVPYGWFLPVTPGTKYVTIGGAIANDVHGKNHHVRGTFGKHVRQFELLRSDGTRLLCSPTTNTNWYQATIGGLGLTGLITWAEIELLPIVNAYIDMESVKFGHLEEFHAIANESDKLYEYTVAWIDCLAKGPNLGRGIFMRGNHSQNSLLNARTHQSPRLKVPCNFPHIALNPLTMKLFNFVYYHKQLSKIRNTVCHYDSFFYPLDFVLNWNRIYGKRGFFQYQFVLPFGDEREILVDIFKLIANSQQGSFLAVLKNFGHPPSPGLLSFPMPGITLALDFPNHGLKSLALFETLDQIIMQAGGRLYPAKDARMSAQAFRKFFPQWCELLPFLDPAITSCFWQRVTQSEPA